LPEKYQSEINDIEHYKSTYENKREVFILSFKLRGEKGKHLALIMFKHNLANTASAIEK